MHWYLRARTGLRNPFPDAGLDAEMGVVMLLYLDFAYERWKERGRMTDYRDLAEAVYHGAVQRIRPKMMTVTTTSVALVRLL